MKFLYAIFALAALATAAPAAPEDAIKARETADPPCKDMWWNADGAGSGDGGWGCITDGKDGCSEYYWKTTPPYWSC